MILNSCGKAKEWSYDIKFGRDPMGHRTPFTDEVSLKLESEDGLLFEFKGNGNATVRQKPDESKYDLKVKVEVDMADIEKRVMQSYDSRKARVIGGYRNSHLFSVAVSTYRETGRFYATLMKLREENSTWCCPPLSDETVKNIAVHVCQHSLKDKGTMTGRTSCRPSYADPKFKVGDEVRITGSFCHDGRGTIRGVMNNGYYNVNDIAFHERDLELIPQPKFTVGQKVKVITPGLFNSGLVGTFTGTVTQPEGFNRPLIVQFDNHSAGYYTEKDLEKVPDTKFKVGDDVTMKSGPFIGKKATVTHVYPGMLPGYDVRPSVVGIETAFFSELDLELYVAPKTYASGELPKVGDVVTFYPHNKGSSIYLVESIEDATTVTFRSGKRYFRENLHLVRAGTK